jgi:hypothetical protein
MHQSHGIPPPTGYGGCIAILNRIPFAYTRIHQVDYAHHAHLVHCPQCVRLSPWTFSGCKHEPIFAAEFARTFGLHDTTVCVLPVVDCAIPFMRFYLAGAIIFTVIALVSVLSYWRYKSRIPLASLLLQVVMDVAKHHKSVYFVAFTALVIQAALSVWVQQLWSTDRQLR